MATTRTFKKSLEDHIRDVNRVLADLQPRTRATQSDSVDYFFDDSDSHELRNTVMDHVRRLGHQVTMHAGVLMIWRLADGLKDMEP